MTKFALLEAAETSAVVSLHGDETALRAGLNGLDGRLLRAWRASGLPLGELIACAARRYETPTFAPLTTKVLLMPDTELIEMCERYVMEAVK